MQEFIQRKRTRYTNVERGKTTGRKMARRRGREDVKRREYRCRKEGETERHVGGGIEPGDSDRERKRRKRKRRERTQALPVFVRFAILSITVSVLLFFLSFSLLFSPFLSVDRIREETHMGNTETYTERHGRKRDRNRR